MGVSEAESIQGNVSLDEANGSIEVATGVPGSPNRVIFDLVAFATPVRIQGSDGGPMGLLMGNTGESANDVVPTADMTAQYRLSSTDTWKAWTRNTLIGSTKVVQFAVDIADQIANTSVPQMWFLAEQI